MYTKSKSKLVVVSSLSFRYTFTSKNVFLVTLKSSVVKLAHHTLWRKGSGHTKEDLREITSLLDRNLVRLICFKAMTHLI